MTDQPTPPRPDSARARGFARFAQGRYATPIMCALSFTDACISPIIPEVVLLPLVLARPDRRYWLAFLVSTASVLGGVLGYVLGMLAWDAGLDRIFFDYVPGFTQARLESVGEGFAEQTFWVMFAAGFTPLPYKVFTVAAGVFHENIAFSTFVSASILSRFLRFYLTVWLLHQFGRHVLDRVSRSLFRVFALLLLLAVLALMWIEL